MNESNNTSLCSGPQIVSDLMKVEEAAKYLKIGRTHCYELIRGGHLPTVQLGRLIRVSRKRLDQWIDEGGMRVK